MTKFYTDFRKNLMTKTKRKSRRSGHILSLTIISVPALLAILGLVIDGGRMIASYQNVRDAADAVAKAAAYELMQGSSDLTSTAFSTVAEYGLDPSVVSINSPPVSGTYAGQDSYVEVIVTVDYSGIFNSILPSGQVSARAVAGHELMPPLHLVSALDTDDDIYAGVNLRSTSSRLRVNGSIIVNSSSGGLDEHGNIVSGDASSPAVRGSGSVEALAVRVNGGVNDNNAFSDFGGSSSNPLDAGLGIEFPDPYVHIPTPTVANGVLNIDRGAPEAHYHSIDLNNPGDDPSEPNYVRTDPSTGQEQLVLRPGIYERILLFSGANAHFEPGIYVLRPPTLYEFGSVLEIDDNANVDARGVMFYFTLHDYDPVTGEPDVHDGYITTEDDHNWYGNIDVHLTPNVVFFPIDTTSYAYSTPIAEEFNGMILYKRRRNNHNTVIELHDTTLSGTIYMQRSQLRLRGSGTLASSVAVRKLDLLNGSGTILVDRGSVPIAHGPQVVLVE